MADVNKIKDSKGTTYDLRDAGAARTSHTHDYLKYYQVLSGESNEIPTAKVGKNWSKIAKIEGGSSNIGLLDIRLTSCSYGDGGNTLFGNVLYSSNSKKITVENRNSNTTALTDFAIVRILDSETNKYTIEFWLRVKNGHKNALFTVNRFYSYNGTRTICTSRGTEHNVYDDTEFTSYLDGKDCVSSATDFIPAIDSNVVHKTGNETIDGDKTFRNSVYINGDAVVKNGQSIFFKNYTANHSTRISANIPDNQSDNYVVTVPNKNGTIALTNQIPDITGKQDKLTAGTNVSISGTTISATDTTYAKVENTDIDNIVRDLT